MEGGTWGLVIIFAAFMIQVLAFGATSTVGVYNIEFLDYFDGATVEVSLIGSLNYGIFLGSGPIVSFLMTKFSYRKIALFGSTLIIIGLLGMPLLPYIPAMCICFGVLAGFGSSCAYIPSHVLSGLYYDKHRSLATGVATSGSGLGGAILPVVSGILIEFYSWKGSLVFMAGLCLHLLVFSALLRAPPPLSFDINIPLSVMKTDETLKDMDVITEECTWKPKGAGHDTFHHDNLGNDFMDPSSNETFSLNGKTENYVDIHQPLDANGHLLVGNKASAIDITEDGALIHKRKHHRIAAFTSQHSLSLTSLHSVGCIRGASQVVVDSSAVIQSSEAPGKKEIPKSARHIYIFTHYGFDVYFASNIMWNAGCAIINAFGAEFLTERGLEPMEAAWFNGAYGFGCFIGGILGGVFGNFKWMNRQVLYTVANIVMGVSTIAFPFCDQKYLYLLCLLVSGIAFGVILGLLIVVLTDLIGVESLGNGLGYLMLSNGLGTFIGPPIAGLMKDLTGGFKEGIILSGVLSVFGGLIMFLMPCKWRCFSQRKFDN